MENEQQQQPDQAGQPDLAGKVKSLEGELAAAKQQLATVTTERDSLAKLRGEVDSVAVAVGLKPGVAAADIAAKHAEVVKAHGDLLNRGRERDLVDHLAGKFPGVDRSAVRGQLLVLVEEGKAQRYPEDPKKHADDVAALLKDSPALAQPTTGGGLRPPPVIKPRANGAATAASPWAIGVKTN